MYIYQDHLKSQLKAPQIVRTEYNGENTELLAQILAEAFRNKNDFFITLNYNYDDLYQEFQAYLISHQYRWILVYYENKFGEKNINNIIGTASYSDINDVQLTQEEKLIKDFDIIPNMSKARHHSRLKALKYFFDNFNSNSGEYCVGGNFAISSQYMREKYSLRIMTDSFEFMLSQGYKYIVAWTPNEIAKKIYDKLDLVLRKEQSLENFYIEQTQTYVFKNTKMIQVLYIFDIEKSIIKLKAIEKSNQQKMKSTMSL